MESKPPEKHLQSEPTVHPETFRTRTSRNELGRVIGLSGGLKAFWIFLGISEKPLGAAASRRSPHKLKVALEEPDAKLDTGVGAPILN